MCCMIVDYFMMIKLAEISLQKTCCLCSTLLPFFRWQWEYVNSLFQTFLTSLQIRVVSVFRPSFSFFVFFSKGLQYYKMINVFRGKSITGHQREEMSGKVMVC